MRSLIRQFDSESWPISTGSVVVSAQQINILIGKFSGNRDGPLIFHMRDGPQNVNGPMGGTGPPEIFSSGFTPPRTLSHPMEWLAKKKTLKKF